MLKEELESDNSDKMLTERDEKGWQILHQGVTSGNKEVVELLVDHGAEINARTYGGYGETPLRIAEKELGFGHPIVDYLKVSFLRPSWRVCKKCMDCFSHSPHR